MTTLAPTQRPPAADPAADPPLGDRTRRVRRPITRVLQVWIWLLTVSLLVAGLLGVAAAVARDQAMADVRTRMEPLRADATTAYRSLATADAAAIQEFVVGPPGNEQARTRFDTLLTAASNALTRAAARVGDDGASLEAISSLQEEIPAYTQLVELARANNRNGHPVGASYLRMASGRMQSSMLPTAERLLQRQAHLLETAYGGSADVRVAAAVAAAGALVALLVAQVWLARRFHRYLNRGLVLATALLGVGVLWWAVAAARSDAELAESQRASAAISNALVPARIAALQARTAEGLALAVRDSDQPAGTTVDPAAEDGGTGRGCSIRTAADRTLHGPDFADRVQRLSRDNGAGGALGAATRLVAPQRQPMVAQAIRQAFDYCVAHLRERRLDVEGDYAGAVAVAYQDGAGQGSAGQGSAGEDGAAATAFAALDETLSDADEAERTAFAGAAASADSWWRAGLGVRAGLGIVAALVALLAAGAAAAGLAERLREFR